MGVLLVMFGLLPWVIVAALLLAACLQARRNLARRDAALAPRSGAGHRRGKALLTHTESLFYPVLRRAAGSCPVMCKVRLMDVAEPTGHDPRAYALAMRQHLDFVVVDPTDWRVLCAVELDDPSHNGFEAGHRDGVKDAALRGAGVPCLRVPVSHHYDAEWLAALLRPVIAGAGLAASLS